MSEYIDVLNIELNSTIDRLNKLKTSKPTPLVRKKRNELYNMIHWIEEHIEYQTNLKYIKNK